MKNSYINASLDVPGTIIVSNRNPKDEDASNSEFWLNRITKDLFHYAYKWRLISKGHSQTKNEQESE
jgi:hypothetical protein